MNGNGPSMENGQHHRLLVLLAGSRDVESIPRILAGVGVASVICSTMEELCAEIGRGAGALLVGEDIISRQDTGCLYEVLESQPVWSELPVILLLRQGTETLVAPDALLLGTNVTLIERPVRVHTLVSVIRSALCDRGRQYLVRDQLKALRQGKEELELRVRERTRELSQALDNLRDEAARRSSAVEELRRNEQILMQQGRLAAMGEMLGNISHQWRQPLNVLGLILQELRLHYNHGLLTGESLEKTVSRGLELILHMSQTIDDFRGFLKPEKVREEFDLGEVVKRSISMVKESLKGIEIRVSAPEAVSATGYRNELAQVVVNLLANARDALQERGVDNPIVSVGVFREDGRSVVTISDNAGGIPEQIIDRIFDPYFTTKDPDKGTGIGLFMSRTIIGKNMGGRLTVRNTEEGAEFRIEL